MDVISENKTDFRNNLWMKATVDYVDSWFLMQSPIPVVTIWISYMLIILKLGPNYMKNRPAFNFPMLLVAYNALQVVFSVYILFLGLDILKSVNYIFTSCNYNEEAMEKITNGMFIYFMAKISELLDTVFFVLRKKYNQVSFLHVYHHSLMLFTVWTTLKFEPSYDTIFLGTINSFVHVIMYAYYALSTFPSLQKYLWWKKYITALQLSQFAMIITHTAVNSTISQCKPSYVLVLAIVLNTVMMLYLFGKFYYKSYKVSEKRQGKPIGNGTDVNSNSAKYTNGGVSKGNNSYNSVKLRSS